MTIIRRHAWDGPLNTRGRSAVCGCGGVHARERQTREIGNAVRDGQTNSLNLCDEP